MKYYEEELDLAPLDKLREILGDPRPFNNGFIWQELFEEIGVNEYMGNATICVKLDSEEINAFKYEERASLAECDLTLQITIFSDYTMTATGTLEDILDIIKEENTRFGFGISELS